MEGKKRKKFPWAALVLLILALGLGAAAGVFFYRNTLVDGRIIPVDSVTLDLRDAGITDVGGLKRCRGLQSVDLRGNDLDETSFRELQEALPECVIRYDVPLGGEKYDVFTQELTLADLPEDWENLKKLVNLRSLTVEKCTNPSAMTALQEDMPQCGMSWSLGLGGEWYDVTASSLSVPGSAVYFEELLSQLRWFPELKSVNLPGAALTPQQQRTLLQTYPDLTFLWTVAVGSRRLNCTTEEIGFSDAESGDLAGLEEVMDLLPALKTVDFSDSPVAPEDRTAFRSAHPELEVTWSVTLFGEVYPCDAQMLDFNNREMTEEDLDELRAAIPYLPALETIELCDTGLSNEQLDAFNHEYDDIRVIWRVYFSRGRYNLRTDAVYFRPSEFGDNPPAVTDADTQILRYCTDMQGLDLGHQYFTDLSFLESMPHMTYLIIAECPIYDLSPLASLKELRYLELFNTDVTDISPLAECTSLKALNLCYIKARQSNAWSTLSKMPWLERLWYCNCPLSASQLRQLQRNNPDLVTFTLYGGESSGGSWRYNQYYYEMRDFFHAWYMPSGTNGVDEDGAQIIIDDHGTEFHLQNYDGSQYWWQSPKYAGMYPYIIGVTD